MACIRGVSNGGGLEGAIDRALGIEIPSAKTLMAGAAADAQLRAELMAGGPSERALLLDDFSLNPGGGIPGANSGSPLQIDWLTHYIGEGGNLSQFFRANPAYGETFYADYGSRIVEESVLNSRFHDVEGTILPELQRLAESDGNLKPAAEAVAKYVDRRTALASRAQMDLLTETTPLGTPVAAWRWGVNGEATLENKLVVGGAAVGLFARPII